MIVRWEDLLEQLKIDERDITDKDIHALVQWCHEQVSEEKIFKGTLVQQFNELKPYLVHFFETIGAHQADGLSQRHCRLKEMNLIQYASLQGYDRYLEEDLKHATNAHVIVNETTKAEMIGLHFAALNGHQKAVEILLKHGADPTKQSRLKQTPLHLSVTLPVTSTPEIINRKLQLFTILNLRVPTLIDAPDITRNTVAHLISQNGFTDLVRELSHDNSARFIKINSLGHSTLQLAILNRHFETAKILALIPELLTIPDHNGRKPIHYAAQYDDVSLLALCMGSEGVDIPDHYLKTALMFAAEAGILTNVRFLVSKGATVAAKDTREMTVLHYAVAARELALVQWLTSNTPVEINATDQLGRTALMTLLVDESILNEVTEAIIDNLLLHGADVSIPDRRGKSVKEYVMQRHDKGLKMNDELFNRITHAPVKMSL